MKKLIILFLPAFMLMACGEMNSNDAQVGQVIEELDNGDYLSEGSQEAIQNLNDPSILDENITVTETSESSMIMKVNGVELLVDFLDEADIIDDESIAMIVNGIEVTQGIAKDPSKLQGLLASIASSVLGDVDIFGVDLDQLVSIGLDLINGNLQMSDLSTVLGVVVEGALNMFLSSVPFGGLIAGLVSPLIDNVLGNDDDNSGNDAGNANNNNSNDNDNGGFLGGIGNVFGSIIGSLTGNNDNDSNDNNSNDSSDNNSGLGSGLFNGIFNLITTLF